MRILVLCVLVIFASSVDLAASRIPSAWRGVRISATVSRDPRTSAFTFQYRVVNPAANDAQIWLIDVEITQSPEDSVLGKEGLVNGPRYLRYTSEEALRQVAMVPVGIVGPENWVSSLGYDLGPPQRGFAGWGAIDELHLIAPGDLLDGFQLTSHGLPGIRAVQVRPWIDPSDVPRNLTTWEELNEFYDRFTFHAKTVAPKAPASRSVPLELLNYLISLTQQSRQLGWITEDGVYKSLLAKLLNAKRRLEVGRISETRGILNAFVHEVRGTSCQDFTCPGNRPLTSEAYALLFFNGQYLLEGLR